MTRAMIADAFGAPALLHPAELPAREPGTGELVIEVRAAGVNPADLKRLRGDWGGTPPVRLGSEVAGIVVAVGPDAVGPAGPIAVGDEVLAHPVAGGFADAVVVAARSVVPKPPGLPFVEGAALLLTGATAAHLLAATEVAAGDTVLVHGAAGGVGAAAVQLAVARGARVLGTGSAASQEVVAALGAEPVRYGPGLLERVRALAPAGVDVALDTVGGDEALDVSVALVADRRRIATIAGFARGAELGIRVLGNGPGADPGRELREAARLPLVAAAASGALRVRVARTFPLDEAAAALELVASGHPGGRVVLVP